MKEEALYPIIHSFFQQQGCPCWTEPEIRKIKWERIRWPKVIPDLVAIKKGSIIVAVEAEPNVSSDSVNHGVGQTGRFSAFAGILYVAFPAPVPKSTKSELLLICPGTGLLEVDTYKRIAREAIKPKLARPKIEASCRQWLGALRDVKKRGKESVQAHVLAEKRSDIRERLRMFRMRTDYRPLIRGISLDETDHAVMVRIRDPIRFTSSEISPEYQGDENYEEFKECCAAIYDQLHYADIFDVFGADTRVVLQSDVFSMLDCGHVGSTQFCPRCGSQRFTEYEERELKDE